MQFDDSVRPPRKYVCHDCVMCQGCSEHRCLACRNAYSARRKKLSIQEQIELYNRLNPQFSVGQPPRACSCEGGGEASCEKKEYNELGKGPFTKTQETPHEQSPPMDSRLWKRPF